jgi:predicted secreted acid phosphatase
MRWLFTLIQIFNILAGASAWACPCQDVKLPAGYGKDFSFESGLKFSETADFRKQFDQAISAAKAACHPYLKKPMMAIVSDIDETLLDNREAFRQQGQLDFRDWLEQAKAPALAPTAEFLSWARRNGFTIFLVTGRNDAARAVTMDNLLKRNIYYDGLLMRPNGNDAPAAVMKSLHRKSIEDMGYTIVVNIGDQYSDLLGAHALDCEKLPNEMYFVP